jgi:hypothetical protein
MHDLSVIRVGDLDDRRAAQRAGIVRLAARRRIERRAVERHAPSLTLALARSHARLKVAQKRIAVIEPLGHECPSIRDNTTRKARYSF